MGVQRQKLALLMMHSVLPSQSGCIQQIYKCLRIRFLQLNPQTRSNNRFCVFIILISSGPELRAAVWQPYLCHAMVDFLPICFSNTGKSAGLRLESNVSLQIWVKSEWLTENILTRVMVPIYPAELLQFSLCLLGDKTFCYDYFAVEKCFNMYFWNFLININSSEELINSLLSKCSYKINCVSFLWQLLKPFSSHLDPKQKHWKSIVKHRHRDFMCVTRIEQTNTLNTFAESILYRPSLLF